jgi:hypothetical protein
MQFSKHPVSVPEWIHDCHLKSSLEILCTYVFSVNDNVDVIYEGRGTANKRLELNPVWSINKKSALIRAHILRRFHYPNQGDAQYTQDDCTNQANPDLPAVFLALRGRIERLLARLQ